MELQTIVSLFTSWKLARIILFLPLWLFPFPIQTFHSHLVFSLSNLIADDRWKESSCNWSLIFLFLGTFLFHAKLFVSYIFVTQIPLTLFLPPHDAKLHGKQVLTS